MHEIKLSPEFLEEFNKLQLKAEKGNGEAKYLLKITEKGITKLAQNVTYGKKVPKKLWPDVYVQKYGINNLWKLNLDGFWRMTYTVTGGKAELIGIVLEVMNHHDYSKRFGYRK